MIQEGQSLGITTWNEPNRFGLSLTLGGGEVKLIDLATVYATLANSGRRPEINPILEVKNSRGETLTKSTCREENRSGCPTTPILDPRVAFLLTDILKDNLARAPEFGLHSFLVIPRHPEVAVKTGTSNNLRDNLTVGYNQNYLVAVWVGNNDNSPMSRVASGVTGASPIWNKIMSSLLADEPSSPWPIPAGLVKNTFCQGSTEWFLNENVPKVICPPTPSPTPESQSQILEGIRTQN
jgi:membrane carboxypeptidase/penicillin-binding protein PbpC